MNNRSPSLEQQPATKQDLADVKKELAEDIDGVTRRLDGLDQRMLGMEGRMDRIEGRFDQLERDMNRRFDRLEELLVGNREQGVQGIIPRLEALEKANSGR